MDVAQTTQNVFPANPALADTLSQFGRSLLLKFQCHHVGILQEFFPETQRATISIAYKKTYLKQKANKQYTTVLVDYPLLLDVPVFFLGNQTAFLTVPPQEGDECLLAFNDRDMDNWYSGSRDAGLATSRLHSVADGFALFGLRSANNAIQDFDTERVRLQMGTAAVAVGKDDLVLIENADQNLRELVQRFTGIASDLNQTISDLTTALTTMVMSGVTTGAGVSGIADPSTQTSFTQALSELAQYSTDLTQLENDFGELLE